MRCSHRAVSMEGISLKTEGLRAGGDKPGI